MISGGGGVPMRASGSLAAALINELTNGLTNNLADKGTDR